MEKCKNKTWKIYSEKKRIRDEQKRKRRSGQQSDNLKTGSRHQSVIKSAPPKSIPPFELPQVHSSGLNGPIYKREELLKKSQEAELFNQAYRATMAQTVSKTTLAWVERWIERHSPYSPIIHRYL